MPDKFLIGIDLGGTKIAAAAFDPDGNRLGKIARLPTMANMQAVVTLTNLKRVVKQAKACAGVDGTPQAVGMGSSGPLDPWNRVLRDKDSLPSLDGFKIGKFVADEIGAPLYLENDAACFTLGEAIHGAGRSHEIVLGATLGTGFGCGLTIRGRIYSGATANAGEVAYCRLRDSDFDHACSGYGVVQRYREEEGARSDEDLTAKQIGDFADRGDPVALRAWAAFGRDVGTALGTVCAMMDPSVVVLGGSVSLRRPLFEASMVDSARSILLGLARDAFRVVPAELGDAAGVTGAAVHAKNCHPWTVD